MSTTDLQQHTGTALPSRVAAPMGKLMQRQTKQALDQVTANTLIALQTEHGRTALAEQCLVDACAISALEEQCLRLSPLGEARYRAIADAHALGAAAAITRYGR